MEQENIFLRRRRKWRRKIFGHGRQRTEKETEENIMEKEKLLRTKRRKEGTSKAL